MMTTALNHFLWIESLRKTSHTQFSLLSAMQHSSEKVDSNNKRFWTTEYNRITWSLCLNDQIHNTNTSISCILNDFYFNWNTFIIFTLFFGKLLKFETRWLWSNCIVNECIVDRLILLGNYFYYFVCSTTAYSKRKTPLSNCIHLTNVKASLTYKSRYTMNLSTTEPADFMNQVITQCFRNSPFWQNFTCNTFQFCSIRLNITFTRSMAKFSLETFKCPQSYVVFN